MKKYLSIIRKLDFFDLFKYGQFNISYAVPFDGDISAHADDDDLFNRLTCRMNMYEYSFEYLIVHFSSEEYNEQFATINVRHILGLYVFDQDAKKEMMITFDPRIQLHVSPWAEKFKNLQQEFSVRQSLLGVDNLWAIFELPESDRTHCEEIITKDAIKEVFRELYAYERPSGDLSIWTYLLRYERHSFYSKDMVGFFCDFIHVYCNFSGKKEHSGEVAESTALYSQLKNCSTSQFAQLSKVVESSPLYKLSEKSSGCRFAIAAPLFLYLKELFSEGMNNKPNSEIISYAKKVGGFECSVAVYLLGIFLGYNKTYGAFYEATKVAFFKELVDEVVILPSNDKGSTEVAATRFPNNNKTDISKNKGGSKDSSTKEGNITEEKDKGGKSTQLDLFQNNTASNDAKKLPIFWMKRGIKGSKPDVRPVYTEEDISEFKKNGFKIIRTFTDAVKKIISEQGFNPEEEEERTT